MPNIPKRPVKPKKDNFIFEVNNIDTIVIIIIIAVPKSGSSIISPKNNAIIRSIGNTPFLKFLTSFSLLDKYLAVKIIRASLESSEGWKPNEPIPNQLLDPLRIFPIPGISTSTNKIKEINKILFAWFLYNL